jgi:hypothetical protein
MKLEQQVCGLELAKRLKELGVEQTSMAWWLGSKDNPIYFVGYEEPSEHVAWNKYAAFTVAELGEMLPSDKYTSRKVYDQWECAFRSIDGDSFEQYADTEADARAKMLIYLIENKLAL